MEVLHEIKPNNGIAIALGYFDGIHIGHKKIISTLVQQARLKGLKTAIITFDKNPADYFSEEKTPSDCVLPDDSIDKEKSGCKSSVGLASLAVLTALGGVLIHKKKEN